MKQTRMNKTEFIIGIKYVTQVAEIPLPVHVCFLLIDRFHRNGGDFNPIITDVPGIRRWAKSSTIIRHYRPVKMPSGSLLPGSLYVDTR